MGAHSRARIKKFVLRIFEHLDNLCWSTMMIPSMDVFPLKVHVEQMNKKKHKKVGRKLRKSKNQRGELIKDKI